MLAGDRLVELHAALCAHAGRALRRHGLRNVEPSDAVTDVLFAATSAEGLRLRLLDLRATQGLEAAVAYVLGAVNNAVWQLHAELDPVGARAFRSLGIALRELRGTSGGPAVGEHDIVFGRHGTAMSMTKDELALLLQSMAQWSEFAGVFACRCPRAMGSRLARVLVAVHQQCCAAGHCLLADREELEGALVEILRSRESQDLRLLAVGLRDMFSSADDAGESVGSWPFAELDARAAELLAGSLMHQLAASQLGGRELRNKRVLRLSAVVGRWQTESKLVDPLQWLMELGQAKQTAYEDRSLLSQALQEQALRMLPELCAA
jgi:hypothetical protein